MATVLWLALSVLAVSWAKSIPNEDVEDFNHFSELLPMESYIFESKIIEILENLKFVLKNGDPSKGIPPLDPFYFKGKDFDFILDDTRLEGFFENVTIFGFSDFNVLDVELNLFPLFFKIEILIKDLSVGGKYKLSGDIFDEFPINATGQFISETTNLVLLLYVKPTILDSSLQLKDLIFEYKIENEKLNYTNEYESNEFKLLDETLALSILEKVQERYMAPLVEMGKTILNDFLLGYTCQEIIQIIMEALNKN